VSPYRRWLSDEARARARLAAEGLYQRELKGRVETTMKRGKPLPRDSVRDRGTGALRFDRRRFGAIFVGGFVGTVARTELTLALPARLGAWPWATLIVNLVGALLLGYFTTRLKERLPRSAYRGSLVGTGLCGGLTTFATMQVELLAMLKNGRLPLALVYAVVSVGGGIAAVAASTNLVRRARLGA
jgi:CrcB protein